MKRLLYFFACICVSLSAYSQTVTFEMTALGINFGQMSITKTHENDSTDLYTLRAKGLLNLLVTQIDEETRNYVRFRNGNLWQSSYTQLESGKTTYWNTITYDGKTYVVESSKGKRTFSEIPSFSVLMLYFKQPASSMTRIFSEAEANYITLTHVDANTLEMKGSGKSGRSLFYYKNGKIDRLEFYTSVAKVNMKKI